MTAVAIEIWWVDEVKGVGRVVALKHLKSVSALNRHLLQTVANRFGESILGIAYTLWHTATKVVPKGTIEATSEALLRAYPYRPSDIYWLVKASVAKYMPCLRVRITRV